MRGFVLIAGIVAASLVALFAIALSDTGEMVSFGPKPIPASGELPSGSAGLHVVFERMRDAPVYIDSSPAHAFAIWGLNGRSEAVRPVRDRTFTLRGVAPGAYRIALIERSCYGDCPVNTARWRCSTVVTMRPDQTVRRYLRMPAGACRFRERPAPRRARGDRPS